MYYEWPEIFEIPGVPPNGVWNLVSIVIQIASATEKGFCRRRQHEYQSIPE